jgi:hypothetical protein
MINKQKQEERKNDISSVVAGAMGAAIGFGVAVVGTAMVLGNKNKPKKFIDVLINVKDQALGYMEGMKKQTQNGGSEIEKLIQASAKTKKEGEKYGSN